MSELREAAQAVINRWYRLPGDNDRAILSDLFARLRAALAQPETESPRDEWRPASEPPEDERAVLVWIPVDYLPTGGVFAIDRCIQSRADPSVRMWSLKPTNWRDVTPPMEGE